MCIESDNYPIKNALNLTKTYISKTGRSAVW